jgi:hypothetical protein
VVYNLFIYSIYLNASSEFMVLIVRIVKMVESVSSLRLLEERFRLRSSSYAPTSRFRFEVRGG